MQSLNGQPHQEAKTQNGFSDNAQKNLFQNYSNMSGKLQSNQNQVYSLHNQLNSDRQEKLSYEVKQNAVEGSGQADLQVHSKGSLIESVDKQLYVHESENQTQKIENLQNVPDTNSNIIHLPVSKPEGIIPVQSQHYVSLNSMQKQINTSVQNQVPQRHVQSSNLRHTITTVQSPIYQPNSQIVSNQNYNPRGSLPPNIMPPQFINTSNYSGSSQNKNMMPNPQIITGYRSQPIQQKTFVQPQQIPQRLQQVVRTPQHMPQGQQIQSQTLFQPIDFIKNAPQRLEQSQLIYIERAQITTTQGALVNQNPQQAQSLIRGQSFEVIRQNTRSLERRKTNVTFNYKIQCSQSLPLKQPQITIHSQKPVIQQKTSSISPQPSDVVRKESQPKPIQVQQSVQEKVVPVAKYEAQKQKNPWEERYFALYSKLLHMNKKIDFIGEDFIKFEKVISHIKQEKSQKRYHRLHGLIQELQQDFTSIVHEWKPEGQIKVQSKQATHIETKYKRLLFNFSKLQEENNMIKKSFQEKIHEVVVKLQKQNDSLKRRLEQIEEPKAPELSSDERQQFEEGIAKLHQKNRMLQDEIARLNEVNEKLLQKQKTQYKEKSHLQSEDKVLEVQNLENIISELNEKLRSYQGKIVVLEEQNTTLKETNQHLIQQVNTQLQQSAKVQSTKIKSSGRESRNWQLELKKKDAEIEVRTSQLGELQEQYNNLEQDNIMLTNELEKLSEKITQLQRELEQSRQQNRNTEVKIKTQQKTDNQLEDLFFKLSQRTQELESLRVGLAEEQQKNTFLRDELARINIKNASLQKEIDKTHLQSKSANQLLIETQQLSSLKTTVSHFEKESLQKSHQIEQLQMQNNKLQGHNVSLKNELERLNEKLAAHETQLKEYRSQIQTYLSQIQEFQTQSLTSPKQQQSPLLIQQYEFTLSTLRQQINRKQNQIERESKLSDQRILDLTEQLKLSYKERENLHKKFEQKTMLLESEREKKEILIRELRDKIYELEHKKRLDESDERRKKNYLNEMATAKQSRQISKLKDDLQQLKAQKQKSDKDNQSQVKRLGDELQQSNQDNLRLKKQIAQLASTVNQLQTMTEVLNKKNMEILELRNIEFENQKLLIENGNLKKQVENLVQQNQRISSQYDKVSKSSIQINRNYKEIQQNLNILNNRFASLQGEYTTTLDSLHRKQQQATKVKQFNQQLQNQLQQSQRQNEKLKNKLKSLQTTTTEQINSLKQQIQTLKNKMVDFDALTREKVVADHKITELQGYKQKYQYQLKQNEELIIKQKSKIKTLQSLNEDLTQQIEIFNDKIKEQQKKASETSKKHKKIIEDLQQKNKNLQEKQLKFQKEKINELETDVKAKQNKIWKLQKQLQEALQRLDNFGDEEMSSQRINYLQQKVKQYEARLFNQAFKLSPSSYDYEAQKVFETQVIYELKEQNDRLREFINEKKSVKPTNDKNQDSSKIEQEIKQAYDEELDEVQGRLSSFNTKLQSLISNGSYENMQSQKKRMSKSPIKMESKLNNGQSSLKVGETEMTSRQFRELQLKYIQLQRYCKNIEVQLLSGTVTSQKSIKQNKVITMTSNHSLTSNQMTFLKEKNRQLEQRVDKLLKMNNQLKENIQILLNQRGQSSSVTYYKEQIVQLKDKINLNDVRIKKLLQENQKLKSQLGIVTKNQQTIQVKLFDYQRKSIQLQRIVNQLNLTKSSLQKDLHSKTQLLQNKQYEINEIRAQLNLSGEKESIVVKSCKQQIQNYESQITKLTNKVRVQQSEIQRLNESMRKKQSDSSQEVGRWRSKANQLQQDLSKLTGEHDKEGQIQSSLRFQVSRLEQQVKAIQYENQQLTEVNGNLTKRLQQSEGKLRESKMDKQMLQNELSNKTIGGEHMSTRIEQQEQEIMRYINQIEILKQEIQRLNDQNRTKQRTSQFQIRTLQDKLTFAEKDLLNLRKYVSTLEDEKRSLEEELGKSQLQVTLLFKDIQVRDQTYSQKQASYEDKIMMLKGQITAIESSSTSLQQNISAMNILRQKYESQIVQLRNQVAILRSQVERYQQIVKEKETIYQQLQKDYVLIDEQRTKQEVEIISLQNERNILNREVQRLTTTIVLKDSNINTLNAKSESLDRQVNQYKGQIALLRQQNQTLNEKIKQLEKSKSSDTKTMLSQITILKLQNQDLKKGIQQLRGQKKEMEEQLTRWMSRVSLLGQENEKLISRTKSLESMASISSQLEILRREKEELKGQLIGYRQQLEQLAQEYHHKIVFAQKSISSLAFLIELNRSVYLQIESLVDQLQFSSPAQAEQVREKIWQQVEKGIKNTKESNEILTGVNIEFSQNVLH